MNFPSATRTFLRVFTAGAALATLLAAPATTAFAADAAWPERPVRMIIPYAAGGVSDVIGRAISEKLGERLKATFVVENKGGAGGTIGMADMAKAKPDGYTLAFSAISPLSLSPIFNPVQYDPQKDVLPVARAMVSPVVLLGTRAFKGSSMEDLMKAAKAEPGSLRWSTSGSGSLGHLMMEQVQKLGGVQLTHIPYKGSGQQMNDALGAQFEVASMNVSPSVIAHIREGALRPLAIAAPSRVAFLPDVPTFSELGYGKASMMSVFGFFAPAGLPQGILQRLNTEINAVVNSPEIQKLMSESSNIAAPGTPEEFAKQIADELQANHALVESAGLKKQ
ncbi:Bug family tripartite tricarboxylate transporter substrate binding protein [Parapusillimonas granuli]|uniref:Tripartite tricarboxylate transporter substrate binding protein n=1 Tax=Parapusillimonas granuli TaxID=380911 RepID=A0A853G1E0_9BURK|nr:tripartite tricarboxylate transporter substrate binding protein [Parapusillimonas granuli]MBB5217120.1 tripartite-type tricarboxylate transporter receptor subunit TctC [Parapusillimonas granuli]MEB2401585.1 tripartite tricarboxylate transporter substrate binding protein [Alcaligenaceae bacterium]NYT50117.1 tripartite tricarboxylate transporter substrate binding protein [Parapusillimonas granuli]